MENILTESSAEKIEQIMKYLEDIPEDAVNFILGYCIAKRTGKEQK